VLRQYLPCLELQALKAELADSRGLS